MPNFPAAGILFMGPVGQPTDYGFNGVERVRLVGDGASDTAVFAVPTTSSIKTLLGCIGVNLHDIPTAGRQVDGTTTTTLGPLAAAPASGKFLDILLYGRGR